MTLHIQDLGMENYALRRGDSYDVFIDGRLVSSVSDVRTAVSAMEEYDPLNGLEGVVIED